MWCLIRLKMHNAAAATAVVHLTSQFSWSVLIYNNSLSTCVQSSSLMLQDK